LARHLLLGGRGGLVVSGKDKKSGDFAGLEGGPKVVPHITEVRCSGWGEDVILDVGMNGAVADHLRGDESTGWGYGERE